MTVILADKDPDVFCCAWHTQRLRLKYLASNVQLASLVDLREEKRVSNNLWRAVTSNLIRKVRAPFRQGNQMSAGSASLQVA